MELVRINDATEDAMLAGFNSSESWIGGNDIATEGRWLWSNNNDQFWNGQSSGSPVGGRYTNWASGQPDNFNSTSDCASKRSGSDTRWDDRTCTTLLSAICERFTDLCPSDPNKMSPGACGCGISDADSDEDGTPNCLDASPDCADMRYAGHDYKFCRTDRTWQSAQTDCRTRHMDLVRIDDAGEDDFVASHTDAESWIGGSDVATENRWLWADTTQFWMGRANGSAVGGLYNNWASGQPDDFNGTQDCQAKRVGSDPRWDDRTCSILLDYVCEFTCAPTGQSESLCNGVDDDCDGSIDEDYVVTTTTCGQGACAATGQRTCTAGAEQNSCHVGTPLPDDASCDGIDNNCNGQVDEGYQSTASQCGVGACTAMGQRTCLAGVEQNSCNAGTPAPDDASCDGIDNNCNGQIDEGYQSTATQCGVGACTAAGTRLCIAGMQVDNCQPAAATPDVGCDAIDDDCDGRTDEGYGSQATSCGQGACAATGHRTCVAGMVQNSCQAGIPATSDNSCDGIDDDCDGQTDESFSSQVTSCGAGGCTGAGTTSCVAGTVVDSCTPAADCEGDCTDAMDDDADLDVDCADADCSDQPPCVLGTACASDDDCVALTGAGLCLPEDDSGIPGGYCTIRCGSADPDGPGCPLGSACIGNSYCAQACGSDSTCEDSNLICNQDGACVPDCNANSARECAVTSQCRASGACASCETADLTCDGVDDDCDGNIDDEYAPQATTCGVGACGRSAMSACVQGVVQNGCTPGIPADDDASCDGVDEDCDGTSDEDYASEPTTCTVDGCAATGSTSCEAGTVEDSCPESEGCVLPAVAPPPLDMTVPTTVHSATSFLYAGPTPVQTGVQPGTLEQLRTAELHGRVLNAQGAALAGAVVTVVDHPEFGSTRSRADGAFDLVINGGQPVTLNFATPGYITAQRTVDAGWNEFENVPDVVLLQYDIQVTQIDLSSTAAIQVAQGSPVSDARGDRQATLMFSQGTQASMTLASGATQPLGSLHVRATEFTVGDSGPAAMPAPLPPNTAYTYAVELSVDEAVNAGATSVQFSQPVSLYVENFLDFPVGTPVPVGYYDRVRKAWIPMANGKVIEILSVSDGLATLDTDGDGNPDAPAVLSGAGITAAEQAQLAAQYLPGTTLWRSPLAHFSPIDCNWPYGPPRDATAPRIDLPPRRPDPCDRQEQGSIIECSNQTLGETIPITGTEFSLNYRSNRVPGRKDNFSLRLPLLPASVPPGLKRVDLEVLVAGQLSKQSFVPASNLATVYTWNGKDLFGRDVQGLQPITARVGYVYDGEYQQPNSEASVFATFGAGITLGGDRESLEVTLWQEIHDSIGALDASASGIGGWTISAHHAYDPAGRTLLYGTGEQVDSVATTAAGTISTITSSSGADVALVIDAQNNLYYYATGLPIQIVRRTPAGVTTPVAGGGTNIYGENIPATQADFRELRAGRVALGPDGSLYIAFNDRIRRVRDGVISTVVGRPGVLATVGFSGDGGPATAAQVNGVSGLDVARDGTLYFADTGNKRLRRVGTDGVISTVAGTGASSSTLSGPIGDGGPAAVAAAEPIAVRVADDGAIYFTEPIRIRRITTDGIINTVAGGMGEGFLDSQARPREGAVATNTSLSPRSLEIGWDGSIYFSEVPLGFLLRVAPTGRLNTVAGFAAGCGGSVEGKPATAAPICSQGGDIRIAQDQSIVFVDGASPRAVRRVAPPMPGLSSGDFFIPDSNGQEAYRFDSNGRHLQTLDAFTLTPIYQFTYDSAGRLATIADVDGDVTTIARDAAGHVTAIVSPFGQETSTTVDTSGWLSSVTGPSQSSTELTHSADGLLTRLTDTRGYLHDFEYDASGRLTKDIDPALGFKRLVRTEQADGHTVVLSTAMGRTLTRQRTTLPTGQLRTVTTATDGTTSTVTQDPSGSTSSVRPDGTTVSTSLTPDPRFGMLAPLPKTTIRTPGARVMDLSRTRTITRDASSGNPLSVSTVNDTVNVNGKAFSMTTNVASRSRTFRSALGRQRVVLMDAKGRPIRVQTPGLADVAIAYNTHGQLTQIAHGTRPPWIATYDAGGLIASLTDPLGRVATYEHDSFGRMSRTTLDMMYTTNVSYDENGNLTSVTPPGRDAHVLEYDGVDNLQSYAPPMLPGFGATTYRYNDDHQRMQLLYPDGTSLDFSYDPSGRLSAVTELRGTTQASYDTSGRVQSIAAPGGVVVTHGYDGRLLTDIQWVGPVSGRFRQTFDPFFRVATESVDTGATIIHQYDADGLPTQIGNLTLNRDAQHGLITGSSLASVTDVRTYNVYGQVFTYVASHNGTSLFSQQLTRDDLGRIIEKAEAVGGTTAVYTYAYTASGALSDVTKDGMSVAHYDYDANGNRLARNSADGSAIGIYTAQDHLVSYGGSSYQYDAMGRIVFRSDTNGVTEYRYDGFGNLLSAALPSGTMIDYVLDGLQRRVGKKVNGVLVKGLLYSDSLRPVAESNASGALVSQFAYGSRANVPDFMIRGGVTYRIIADHLGSPRLVVNATTGQVAQQLEYDEFGNVLLDTNPGFQPFGFAGGLYDADTGLVQFGSRDYDAVTGRWTAKDPILFEGGDANLYAYVSGDPINWVDPTGEILFAVAPALYWAAVTIAGGTVVAAGGVMAADALADAIEGPDPARSAAVNNALSDAVTINRDIATAYLTAGFCGNYVTGQEFAPTGKPDDFRIAPAGNRTGHPTGRFPHYHRRETLPNGETAPGGSAKRHRPWDSRTTDKSFRDRF